MVVRLRGEGRQREERLKDGGRRVEWGYEEQGHEGQWHEKQSYDNHGWNRGSGMVQRLRMVHHNEQGHEGQ